MPSKSIIKTIGKVTNESVLKHTKKNWHEWVEILDKSGARYWTHQEIVRLLKTKYKLTIWWQQGVTSGYEIYVGRRVEGQNLKGGYSTVATKTIHASKKTIWNFITSPQGMAVWLKPMSEFKIKPKTQYEVYGGIFGEVRTMKPGERFRMTWQELEWEKPSIVQVHIISKPKDKCMLIIQHENLKTASLKTEMLKHWKQALADVEAALKLHS